MIWLFVACRAVAAFSVAPRRFPDSSTYDHLDWLGRGGRLWLVPAIYHVAASDGARVAVQLVVGVGAWVYAAWALGSTLERPHVRVGAQAAVLLVGLARPVTSWDSIILSESLSLSLAVVMVSAWLLVQRGRRGGTVGVAVASTFLWLGTRHVNVLLAVPMLVALAAALRARLDGGIGRRVGVCALLVAVAWGATGLSSGDSIRRYNSLGIIADRMLPDPARRAYVEHERLPMTPALAATSGRFGAPSTPLYDPALARWIDTSWDRVYAEYLLTHPVSALLRPLTALPTIATDRSDRYYQPGQWGGPEALQRLTWGENGMALWWWLVIALLLLALRARAGTLDERDRDPWIVLGLAAICGVIIWHLSASELPRLIVPVAVAARLALLTSIAASCDRLLPVRSAVVVRPPGRPRVALPRMLDNV